MKAMILAAGRGKRMRPLTDHTPKPLLKVGAYTLIEHHIQRLANNDITEIVINTAWLGEKIHAYLGNGQALGVNIAYSHENEALETAGGIINALPLLGDAPFLVVNGDVFSDFALPAKQFPQPAHLVLVNNPEHNPNGDFGLNGHLVTETSEKRYTFSGIGYYHPSFFAGCKPGVAPLAPLLRQAMQTQQVSGELHTGEWNDVGTPERLDALNQRFQSA